MALVGESGCGKSVTALSIMRLIRRPGRIVRGEVLFQGEDLLRKSGGEMRRIRGGRIAMVFQDPLSTLNPTFSVENQIVESLRIHRVARGKEARERSVQLLEAMGIERVRTELSVSYSGRARAPAQLPTRAERGHAAASDARYCRLLRAGAADCR